MRPLHISLFIKDGLNIRKVLEAARLRSQAIRFVHWKPLRAASAAQSLRGRSHRCGHIRPCRRSGLSETWVGGSWADMWASRKQAAPSGPAQECRGDDSIRHRVDNRINHWRSAPEQALLINRGRSARLTNEQVTVSNRANTVQVS